MTHFALILRIHKVLARNFFQKNKNGVSSKKISVIYDFLYILFFSRNGSYGVKNEQKD